MIPEATGCRWAESVLLRWVLPDVASIGKSNPWVVSKSNMCDHKRNAHTHVDAQKVTLTVNNVTRGYNLDLVQRHRTSALHLALAATWSANVSNSMLPLLFDVVRGLHIQNWQRCSEIQVSQMQRRMNVDSQVLHRYGFQLSMKTQEETHETQELFLLCRVILFFHEQTWNHGKIGPVNMCLTSWARVSCRISLEADCQIKFLQICSVPLQNVRSTLRLAETRPSVTFSDLQWPSVTFSDLQWPSVLIAICKLSSTRSTCSDLHRPRWTIHLCVCVLLNILLNHVCLPSMAKELPPQANESRAPGQSLILGA